MAYSYRDDILNVFDKKLEEWKRSSYDGQHFYHVQDFEAWMEATQSGESSNNTELLLRALYAKIMKHHIFPFHASAILNGTSRCVKVFGILLKLRHGELIPLFKTAGVHDSILTYQSSYGIQLQETLSKPGLPTSVMERFEEAKWSFCPVKLARDMSDWLEPGHILPFCKRQRVNEKGGQATVFEVLVRKEFVSEDLHEFLPISTCADGQCFRMAIKEYEDNMTEAGQKEYSALSIFNGQPSQSQLRVNDTPLIRALGQFMHKKTIGEVTLKTYNILMEYGEQDLDEYFAGNEPPSGPVEIVSFYESLFKIADALKIVHGLDYDEKRQYYGLHGDVKPDNILFVDGKFKLADFGFAKFKVKSSRGEKGSSIHLAGGTKTFGPPEGTESGADSSFDRWSFGTVLLLAATWVVLGNNGLYKLAFLRRTAIATLKASKPRPSGLNNIKADDSFHNGETVLAEVKVWYEYLKQRIRHSDKITSSVLDLIEKSLLVERTTRSSSTEDLCEKLKDIIRSAAWQAQILEESDKSKSFLEAMFVFEKAVSQNLDTVQPAEIYLKDAKLAMGNPENSIRIPVRGLAQGSQRIDKSTKLGKTPVNQTSHSMQALEKEMNRLRIPVPPIHGESVIHVQQDRGQALASNVQSVSVTGPSPANSAILNGKISSPNLQSVSEVLQEARETNATQTPPAMIGVVSTEALASNGESVAQSTPQAHLNSPFPTSNALDPGPESISVGHKLYGVEKQDAARPSQIEIHPSTIKPAVASSSKIPNGAEKSNLGLPSGLGIGDKMPNGSNLNTIAEQSEPSSVPYPDDESNNKSKASLEPPSKTLFSRATSPNTSYLVPEELKDVKYPIFDVRWELEGQKPKGLYTRTMERLKGETPDTILKRKIKDRDMVFVVDNGSSMHKHRHIVTFIVETLAMKLAGIDKDGLDLIFAHGDEHNQMNKKKDAPKIFRKAMLQAWPDRTRAEPEHTNMSYTLGRIFTEYLSSARKNTTLLILTDGIWDNPDETDGRNQPAAVRLERKIVDFMTKITERLSLEDRKYTLQFIQLGNDERASMRMQRLDNEMNELYTLSQNRRFPDIIDHVHWTGGDHKMLVGSILDREDEESGEGASRDPDQEPPPDLNRRLETFYKNVEGRRIRTDNLTSGRSWTRNSIISLS